jgi:hypothetical protein
MGDPARKLPLDPEDTARLASGADVQYYVRRTPGLDRMSPEETLVAAIIVAIIGGALYIHIDVAPFLPFEIPTKTADWLSAILFVAVALALLRILGFLFWLVLGLALMAIRKVSPPKLRIACHPCGARISPDDYSISKSCPKCNSNKVYCAKCGRASFYEAFYTGAGCEHCGHPYVALK